MAASFSYSALPQESIRLLQFSRDTNDELVCEMNVVPRTSCQGQYDALSYVWGSDTTTRPLLCNGFSMNIRATLYEAIHTLFSPPISLDLPIWIDAMCIHQSDDLEKNVQVRRMGDIYRNARQVVVWLGPSRQDSDLAMDWMEALSVTLPTIPHQPSFSMFQEYGLPDEDSMVWLSLGHLFRREWFGRLWTFQEVVLAPTVLFVCGKLKTKKLAIVGHEISRLSIFDLCFEYQGVDLHEDGFRAMADVYGAREDIARFSDLAFTYLLGVADSKLCLDPHDRVYAMLGMARKGFRDRINISYSDNSVNQGFIQTYIDCAKACIEERLPMILELVGGRENAPGLPSWCPNLNSRQETEAFGDHVRAGIQGDELSYELFSGKTTPGCNDLLIRGFQVDAVSEVVEIAFPSTLEGSFSLYHKKFLEFENQCLELALITLSAPPDDIPMEHIFTMRAYTRRRMPNAEDYDLFQAYHHCLVNSKRVAQDQGIDFPPREHLSLFYDMFRWIANACIGRRYFSTANGRVGLGPPNIEKGDKICVFYGCGPLFALREVEERTGEWRLIGDAFVHGLMELNETPQSARGPDEEFVII
jgi:hypothetical protein